MGPFALTIAESPDSGNGLFPELELISEAKVIDGMSRTAAVSERLRGTDGLSPPLSSSVFFGSPPLNSGTANDSLLVCRIYGREQPAGVHV